MLGKNLSESTTTLTSFKKLAGWPPSSGLDEVFNRIADSAADANFPGALLPRFHGEQVIYYGVAPTARSWRELRPLLNAFSGPTLTNFTGMSAVLRPDDGVEAFLLSLGPYAVARLIPSETTTMIAAHSLRRMRILLASLETNERNRPEPTSQILNSFRIALAIPDSDAARLYIHRLRSEFRIDALNIRFLEIQLYAALGKWGEILQKDYFNSLCLTRRSKAVTSALIEALYRVHIAPREDDIDPSALVELFRSSVKPVSGDLFEFMAENLSAEPLKMFTLEALAAPSSRRGRLNSLNELASSEEPPQFASFWAKMGVHLPKDTARAESPEIRFKMLIQNEAAPTVGQARAALVYAFETGSIETCREVVDLINRMTESEQLILLGQPATHRLWSYILEETGGSGAPGNWLEWFHRIGDPLFTEAVQIAERAFSEWPSDAVLNDPTKAAPLAEAIRFITEGLASDRFARALPTFILWLKEDSAFPNRAAMAVYENLLDFLALYPARSNEDLFVVSWLLDGVLLLGTAADRYRGILDAVSVVAGEAGALRSLDWLLDVMELAIVHPCPDVEIRDRFLYLLIGQLTPFAAKMSRSQAETLAAITRMLGWGVTALGALSAVVEAPPPVPFETPLLKLSGRTVGFYSLTESVGKLVGDVLKRIVPSARFSWNGDMVGTDSLRALSRDADLFIIMTQSAKHAATEFIHMHRRDKPVLYPRGRGSSSVLRDLEEYCAKLR